MGSAGGGRGGAAAATEAGADGGLADRLTFESGVGALFAGLAAMVGSDGATDAFGDASAGAAAGGWPVGRAKSACGADTVGDSGGGVGALVGVGTVGVEGTVGGVTAPFDDLEFDGMNRAVNDLRLGATALGFGAAAVGAGTGALEAAPGAKAGVMAGAAMATPLLLLTRSNELRRPVSAIVGEGCGAGERGTGAAALLALASSLASCATTDSAAEGGEASRPMALEVSRSFTTSRSTMPLSRTAAAIRSCTLSRLIPSVSAPSTPIRNESIGMPAAAADVPGSTDQIMERASSLAFGSIASANPSGLPATGRSVNVAFDSHTIVARCSI